MLLAQGITNQFHVSQNTDAGHFPEENVDSHGTEY